MSDTTEQPNSDDPKASEKKKLSAKFVRERTGMYVGSTGFWGLVNYVVAAVRLPLSWGATRIEFSIGPSITIRSDAQLPSDFCRYNPFEEILTSAAPPHDELDPLVVRALSKRLVVRSGSESFEYAEGNRIETGDTAQQTPGLSLNFAPDPDVFSVTHVPEPMLRHFLSRLSFSHPNVEFLFTSPAGAQNYSSPRGMLDLLAHMSSAYQILHEPIHLVGGDDELTIDLAFAFHSTSEDVIWSFANDGRVPEGGTHETGLKRALNKFRSTTIDLSPLAMIPGYIAVFAFNYPHVQYSGCIKSKVGNKELVKRVSQLVRKLLANSDLSDLSHMTKMTTFESAPIWKKEANQI